MKKFDNNFLLGAATAAHQVEGNNIHSDSWALEQSPFGGYAEPSLDACDHYNRYEEDIKMMAAAGLNAYRFSVEWARIEPEEGQFDEAEAEHYRKVIARCRANGLEPVVTLHHFSSPAWLMGKGGWESEEIIPYFARYVRFIISRIGSELHYVCTINEANIGLQIMSVTRQFLAQMAADGKIQLGISAEAMMAGSPETQAENMRLFGVPDPHTFLGPRTEAGDAMIQKAHLAARKEIKALFPDMKVGLTLSLHDIQALPGGEANAHKVWEQEFLHYLPAISEDEFLGVQNYTRSRYNANGELPVPENAEKTLMGYEFYPQAIGNVLHKVAENFRGELLATENGVAVSDDRRRIAFINTATDGIAQCIADGLPVKGYFYWSLLDNFEWQKGFGMTFGLVSTDRQNGQKRTPRESLSFLGSLR